MQAAVLIGGKGTILKAMVPLRDRPYFCYMMDTQPAAAGRGGGLPYRSRSHAGQPHLARRGMLRPRSRLPPQPAHQALPVHGPPLRPPCG